MAKVNRAYLLEAEEALQQARSRRQGLSGMGANFQINSQYADPQIHAKASAAIHAGACGTEESL